MITLESSGAFKKSNSFLSKLLRVDIETTLKKYAQEGVDALANATPMNTGETALSWSYKITKTAYGWEVSWTNSHINNGQSVAILLQYGHGTGTGGYVQGQDYINPVIKPIFDKIAHEIWKVVTTA